MKIYLIVLLFSFEFAFNQNLIVNGDFEINKLNAYIPKFALTNRGMCNTYRINNLPDIDWRNVIDDFTYYNPYTITGFWTSYPEFTFFMDYKIAIQTYNKNFPLIEHNKDNTCLQGNRIAEIVKPYSGNFYIKNEFINSVELFQSKLTKPLKKDSVYYFEMYYYISVCKAKLKDFENGNFGISFFTTSLKNKRDYLLLLDTLNHTIYVDGYEKALNKWTKFSAIFSVKENRNYIIIGNTKPFIRENNIIEGNACGYTKNQLNIYIDKISLFNYKDFFKQATLKQGDKFTLENIEFTVNSNTLKQKSFITLDLLVNYLKANNFNIEISGHTDDTGNFKYNLQLSEARAKAVYNYLIEKGISSSRMSYIGYGSTKPIVDNNTKENRIKNRRVEIEIL